MSEEHLYAAWGVSLDTQFCVNSSGVCVWEECARGGRTPMLVRGARLFGFVERGVPEEIASRGWLGEQFGGGASGGVYLDWVKHDLESPPVR